ncbi:MAG: ABC transporter ATP-binding protein [Eubacteriaceae bacterium]
MLAVSINKLSKTYNNKNVLKNISLDIEKGKIYGILGKNGAGKTTLLKIICGLTKISRGDIYVFGKVPTTGNNNINYLSENISLYLHLTAYENLKIIYLMEGKKVNKKEIYNVLEKVSLLHMHNKHVRTFSLGMKRRLQLAMVLCTNQKDLLILDEPTNGLDFDGMEWFKSTISF